MRRPRSVMVFLVRLEGATHSYLLFQRHALPQYALPAFWQAVTGALEREETFADAAIREVHEETSVTLPSVVDTTYQYRFPIQPQWRSLYGPGPSHIIQRVFYAAVPASTTPRLSPEHKQSRWCQFHEAEALLTFGGNRQCLLAVQRHLTAKHPACRPTPRSR